MYAVSLARCRRLGFNGSHRVSPLLFAGATLDPPSCLGIEEVRWIVAPRLVEVDLTLRYPPSLDRWLWLKRLFHSNRNQQASDVSPVGDQLFRVRQQVQEPLRLKLMEVYRLNSGDSINGTRRAVSENAVLDRHELIGALMDLISDTSTYHCQWATCDLSTSL